MDRALLTLLMFLVIFLLLLLLLLLAVVVAPLIERQVSGVDSDSCIRSAHSSSASDIVTFSRLGAEPAASVGKDEQTCGFCGAGEPSHTRHFSTRSQKTQRAAGTPGTPATLPWGSSQIGSPKKTSRPEYKCDKVCHS